MHELGVVFHVIDEVEKIAQENQVNQVKSLSLELGEVSSVIPYYLKDCFDWAKKKHPLLTECELKIIPIKAITYCSQCGNKYDTLIYKKICPSCGSEKTYLIQGNEFIIKDIEVI